MNKSKSNKIENSNLENMQCTHKTIGGQKVGWYVVMDKETSMEYGLFELRLHPKLAEDPTHTSHMRLVVNECISDQVEENNYRPLGKFCHHCFHAVLALTEEEGLIECRIRAEDDLILDIYRIYADALNEEEGYEVSNHKRMPNPIPPRILSIKDGLSYRKIEDKNMIIWHIKWIGA